MLTKEIRNEIVTKLLGNTAALSNVSSASITPLMLENLPAIIVFTPNRTAENIDHNDPTFNKEVAVEINCIVGDLTTFADDLDDLLEEIKQTLFSDETWYSQFENIDGYAEEITLNTEGETNFATGTLSFSLLETVEPWI